MNRIPQGCIVHHTQRYPPGVLSLNLDKDFSQMAPPAHLQTNSDPATYLVDGMTCAHCKVAVTDEVMKVAGVASVDVDLDTKLVRVRGTDVNETAVVVAIDEAGYDAVAAGNEDDQ